jgi:quercetin dioxygenase-like cupin family protein
MADSTTAVEVKNFDHPDEARPFAANGELLLVTVAGREIGKGVFEPGWRWSSHVKPIAGTESCEFPHFLYVVSGRMRVLMDDGREVELRPGDVAAIPPGHDAEVLGDEPCVTVDIGEEDADYAKRD